MVQVFGCDERAGLNGKEETLKPGVVYDGIITGESDFVFLFYIDGSFMSKFQPRAKIFRFRVARLIGSELCVNEPHFWITFNQRQLLRVFASNSARQCIPYATQMRTSVAVRSVFAKAIEMNRNVSKCGLIEKLCQC